MNLLYAVQGLEKSKRHHLLPVDRDVVNLLDELQRQAGGRKPYYDIVNDIMIEFKKLIILHPATELRQAFYLSLCGLTDIKFNHITPTRWVESNVLMHIWQNLLERLVSSISISADAYAKIDSAIDTLHDKRYGDLTTNDLAVLVWYIKYNKPTAFAQHYNLKMYSMYFVLYGGVVGLVEELDNTFRNCGHSCDATILDHEVVKVIKVRIMSL